ncbi:MAG: carbohydrate ABC transporter permease [Candidatus Nanopelagicaceae bacterium]|nr:carbohydrate ABC transporter permease [Candidatus Nanopelagicaceae bacterium]
MLMRLAGRLTKYLFLVFIALVGIAPLLYLLLLSTKMRIEIGDLPPSLKINWEVVKANYEEVLIRRSYIKNNINSFIITGLTVFFSLSLATPAAYVLSKVMSKRSDSLSTNILSLRFMPPIAVAVPIMLMMRSVHLNNTHVGLVAPYVAASLPLAIWILLGFFDEIPNEIEEAAMLDGASRIQTFFRVNLPLVRPGIAVAGIFSAILIWNEFLVGMYLIDSESLKTVPIAAAGLISAQRPIDWNIAATVGVVTLVPLLVASFFVQKHLVKGITAGAIK